jgi:hypothetical protein
MTLAVARRMRQKEWTTSVLMVCTVLYWVAKSREKRGEGT